MHIEILIPADVRRADISISNLSSTPSWLKIAGREELHKRTKSPRHKQGDWPTKQYRRILDWQENYKEQSQKEKDKNIEITKVQKSNAQNTWLLQLG